VAEWSRHEFLRKLPCVLLEVETWKAASMTAADTLEAKIKEALSELIVSIDRDLPEPAATNGGATISFVLHYRNVLYLVNTGDSQSYLVVAIVASRNRSASDNGKESPSGAQLQAVTVLDSLQCWSTDLHKPLKERARLEAAGMQVTDRGRVKCNTAAYTMCMSRSIGDREMVGLIATPEVESLPDTVFNDSTVERYHRNLRSEAIDAGSSTSIEASQAEDAAITTDNVRLFAVSATDGIFDHVSSYKFCSLLAEGLLGNKEHIALTVERIFNEAKSEALDKSEQMNYDDMAIAIAQIL
jgi:serine/threonine protein phosphatase PrpC